MKPLWHSHNAFQASIIKAFEENPPTKPIEEDLLAFKEKKEILQPKAILKHEDNLPHNGKFLQ